MQAKTSFSADDRHGATIVRVARIAVDPGRLEAYRHASRRLIDAVAMHEPGVLALYALETHEVLGNFLVVEVYRDDAAYHAHLQTAHFKAYKSAVAPLVRSLALSETTIVAMTPSSQVR
ncbi:hypothetical protein ASF73_04750 [Xanthomonas sp. Leaf131]|nr:hypothetical protein ASF73_04750 [Xanthomonas sp. Leaf131]